MRSATATKLSQPVACSRKEFEPLVSKPVPGLVVHPDPLNHPAFRTPARRMVSHLDIDGLPIAIQVVVEGRGVPRQDDLRLTLMKHGREFPMMVVRHLDAVDFTTPNARVA